MISNNTGKLGSSEDMVSAETDNVLVPFYSTEASCIILINLLTIITFTINKHLRKRNLYCVVNLAVADMLFGVGVLVYLILWKMHSTDKILSTTQRDQSSVWRNVPVAVIGSGTMLSLTLVAVERMCATVWPMRHRNASPLAYTLAFSVVWATSLINGLLEVIIMNAIPSNSEISGQITSLLLGLGLCVVVGVICVSYIKIFIKVKQQQQEMAGQRISTRDKRLAMTLFIVTVASFGAWIPLALICLLTAKDVIVVPYYVFGVLVGLGLSNSLINPIIYVLRMRNFRKALLRLLVTCSRDRPTRVIPRPN